MKKYTSILSVCLIMVALVCSSFGFSNHKTQNRHGSKFAISKVIAAPVIKVDTNITRWGGSATVNNPTNQDNTFRQLTNRYFTPTDGTGADTVYLYPRAFNTVIQYTAVDSLAFNVNTLSQSYIGDQLTFLVLNGTGSGHQVKFVGSNWQSSTSGGLTIALTSAKRATITFMFDGTYWLEQSRNVQ